MEPRFRFFHGRKTLSAWLGLTMFVLGHITAPSAAGTEPCEGQKIKVRLTAVCPVGKDIQEGLFFEDAKHPLLTFEAKDPEASKSSMASFGPALPDQRRRKPFSIVRALNLLEESLFQERFQREVNLIFSDASPKVRVYVCDDTNQDGRCSDEKLDHQLSLRNLDYSACEVPKELAISVWAGCR